MALQQLHGDVRQGNYLGIYPSETSPNRSIGDNLQSSPQKFHRAYRPEQSSTIPWNMYFRALPMNTTFPIPIPVFQNTPYQFHAG